MGLVLCLSQENLCVLSSIPIPWCWGLGALSMGKTPKDPTAVVDSSCKTIQVKCNSSFYLAFIW